MVFTTAQPFPVEMTPMANIAAVTYRDGTNFMREIAIIKRWLNESLVPEFNEGIGNAIVEFQNGIRNAELTVENVKADWTAQWTQFMTDVDAYMLGVTDDSATALLGDTTSSFNAAVTALMIATVDPRAQAVAAAYIGTQPAVVDAAAAAVNANPNIAALQSAQWNRGALANATNLATLTTPGTWYTTNSTNVTSIVGKPSDAHATNPFRVDVTPLSVTNGAYHMLMTQWTASGPQQWETVSLSNVYQGWVVIENNAGIASLKAGRWDKGALALNTDLSTYNTNGTVYANTSTIVGTLLDKPVDLTVNPFRLTVADVSVANGIKEQVITQWDGGYLQKWSRMSLSGVYPAWVKEPTLKRWTYAAPVICRGDSLTEVGYAQYLGTYINAAVTNRGLSGDTSNGVLFRAGVIKLFALPVGGNIPASGAVTLDIKGRKLTMRDNRTFAVTYAGIPGTLTHTTADVWTFTRTTAGTVKAVTAMTQLVSTTETPENATTIDFFGTNDAWHGGAAPEKTTAQHVKANYSRVIDSTVASPEKHALILGMVTSQSTTAGSTLHNLVTGVNQFCEDRAPHLFINLQDYLVNQAMADQGLTPTPGDVAATSAGLIPPSLYVDDLHFTQATQMKIAENLIAVALKTRGWA